MKVTAGFFLFLWIFSQSSQAAEGVLAQPYLAFSTLFDQIALRQNPPGVCVENLSGFTETLYESCPRDAWRNDYVEKDIQSLLSKNDPLTMQLLDRDFDERNYPKECSLYSMKRVKVKNDGFSATGQFKDCSSSTHGNGAESTRPCITPLYHKLVHNAFMLVNRCFALDPRATSGKIMAEGQSHINLQSGTGAGGTGQITQPWIEDVNDKLLEKYRVYVYDLMADKEKPVEQRNACDQLSSYLKSMKPSQSDFCERVSLPYNPVLNYFYSVVMFYHSQASVLDAVVEKALNGSFHSKTPSIALFKKYRSLIAQDKKEIADLEAKKLALEEESKNVQKERLSVIETSLSLIQLAIDSLNSKMDRIRFEFLTNLHKDSQDFPEDSPAFHAKRILNDVAMYSHNGGVPSTKVLVEKYLESKDILALNYEVFSDIPKKTSFAAYVAENYPGNQRRKAEVSNYLGTYQDGSGAEDSILLAVKSVETKLNPDKINPEEYKKMSAQEKHDFLKKIKSDIDCSVY